MHIAALALAILFEVAGTTCMKLAGGFRHLLPSILVFLFYGISLAFLTLALQRLAVSTAYVVWAGLGTVLITLIGVVGFRESLGPLKALCILLILAGVVGLHLMEAGR
jgi:small multidrug resistance pump